MKTPMTRESHPRASRPRGGKWKKNLTHFKSFSVNGKELGTSRSSYRIESVLSSFVPWLFHNRLWYNSACSCIPYVYAPATSTSGRVNTISRYAHVAYLSYEEYIMLSAYWSHLKYIGLVRVCTSFSSRNSRVHFRDLSRDKLRRVVNGVALYDRR